jgi:transposase-like protein
MFLLASRWPDGFLCPRCGHDGVYRLATRLLLQCRSCRHQTLVTAGTVLHRSRLPLSSWFAAAYLVTTHTPGFSALQLQRELGLSRYETAFVMLQKLRRAMLRPGRDRLFGTVEVDETYVGGVEAGRRGAGRRGPRTPQRVVGRGTARRCWWSARSRFVTTGRAASASP